MNVQVTSEVSGSPVPSDQLTKRQRFGILIICSMALLIVGLDSTIVNIALPSIGHSLHSSVSGLQWTIDAYTLFLASFLMLSGSTGDRLGRKRMFMIGLATFSTGSLLCSLAPNLGSLVVFRAFQGIGASMLNPVAMSIITNTFTDARERAKAIGIWATMVGFSMALGPVVGGLLVGSLGWRSIFWINIPVGVAAIFLTKRFVPESRAEKPRHLDAVGQVLVIAFLASLTFGIIEAPEHGWASSLIIGAFVVAGFSLVSLISWEIRREEPLLNLRFFRSAPFAGAGATAIFALMCFGGFLFINTLYLQDVRGFSALRAGIYTLPMAAMVIIMPNFAGRLMATRGARIPLVLAGITQTAGCLLLVRLNATTPLWYLFVAYVIFGFGFGLVNTPLTATAVAGMPRAQAGVAAAVTSTSRQVGQTLGVAVVGAILTASLGGSLLIGHSPARIAEFVQASQTSWWLLASCAAMIFFLGFLVTSKWARATANKTAQEHNPEFLKSSTQ